MASRVPGANTGEAFIGGAQTRNLAPPNVVGQGIPSANTSVGAPVGGVNPSQMKQARPNEGSNIGLPYTRLVPLNNRNALFAPNYSKDPRSRLGSGVNKLITETEDLRPYTLAFVLGLRGATGQAMPTLLGEGAEDYVYNGHNVGFQPALMPGMPGTERFQQLCSLEYLQAYFHHVLAGKAVKLDTNTMITPGDLAKAEGLANSVAADADAVYQGIFARDYGPFLKGRGGKSELVTCTKHNLPDTKEVDDPSNPGKKKTVKVNPFSVSRNLGDDKAFEALEAALAAEGLTDWRPDGIVLSKGANDPSDKLSDEMLEARDGALFNLRVQGPAIGTTWTGERSMETLPMDKVFVVLIADVWFDNKTALTTKYKPDPTKAEEREASLQKVLGLSGTPGFNSTQARTDYMKLREAALAEELNKTQFEAAQQAAWTRKDGGEGETPVLCNFRLEASTSAEMINYSQRRDRKAGATQFASKKRKLDVGPRMNLELCDKFGEYIVGGWQIGNVMDTSASRAAMPQGSNIGVRTAPNSSALNINVNIGWWSADRLARAFNNPDGTVTPRYVKTKVLATSTSAINQQLTQEAFDIAANSAADAARVAGLTRSATAERVEPPQLNRTNTAARPGGAADVSGVQAGA